MSGALRIEGGLPAVAAAIAAEAEGHAAAFDAIVDLGLPPAEWPEGEALVEAEARRARDLAAGAPADARYVRISWLGASPDADAILLRAQAAAESAVADRAGPTVVLRTGIVLGDCGLVAGLRRRVEKSPVLPLPPIGRSKIEPLALADLARYARAAALEPGPFDDRYDLGCGEILTGGLLVRGLVENLGLRRLVLPLPGLKATAVAALYATPEFPRVAVARSLEAIRCGLLPRRMNVWKDFDIEPVALRLAMADAAGMMIPLRRGGEGRFGSWKKPEKKGILWTKTRK